MKKDKSGKLLRLILTAAVLLVMIPASVFAASDEGDFVTKDDGSGGVVITDYKGTGGAVEIPATIGGKKVTSIGDNAFAGCSSLTSITIPDSVTSIGDNAFVGCSSLTSITIPDSVISIGVSAFSGCSSLTSITIPDSVTSIGEEAFQDCSSLTSITIPDSVTSIERGTFDLCSNLTSITIPDSVTSIGDAAFHFCTSLTSVTIPDSVTSIGDAAFHLCTSLTSVTIPDSVTTIGEGAFGECSSLTSIIIPDSVTSIAMGVFYGCYDLESIIIPDSVTSIGGVAFLGCISLTSIIIPDSVTTIGEGAFTGCSSLTSIRIPDSVTSIGDTAFWGCISLTSMIIPDSVTSIGDDAFLDCDALADIYYIGTEETWKSMTEHASVPEDATVHYMKLVERQAPTCTEDGWRSFYECNDCGVLYDGEKDAVIEDLEVWKKGEGKLPKLGHKTGEWQKDDNGHWLVCERCGEKVDAAEHAYGDWNVVTEAEGDTEGLEKRVCTVCGHEQTRAIPAADGQVKTGDDSSMMIWILLMAGALAGTGLILRRRHQD